VRVCHGTLSTPRRCRVASGWTSLGARRKTELTLRHDLAHFLELALRPAHQMLHRDDTAVVCGQESCRHGDVADVPARDLEPARHEIDVQARIPRCIRPPNARPDS